MAKTIYSHSDVSGLNGIDFYANGILTVETNAEWKILSKSTVFNLTKNESRQLYEAMKQVFDPPKP